MRGISGENSRKIRISSIEPEFITPKSPQTKAILMQKEVRSFIDSVVAKNTRKTYIRALELLEEYMGKSIAKIIEERREDFRSDDITLRRRLDRKVEAFYAWLINQKGMKPNTAYAYITGIKSIMSFYDISLKLKVKKPRSRANDLVPSIQQLREMYEVSDLTEKTILAMATSDNLVWVVCLDCGEVIGKFDPEEEERRQAKDPRNEILYRSLTRRK